MTHRYEWLKEHSMENDVPCWSCRHYCVDYEDPDPGACGSGCIMVDQGCALDKADTGEPIEAAEQLHYCPFYEEDTSAEDEAAYYADIMAEEKRMKENEEEDE